MTMVDKDHFRLWPTDFLYPAEDLLEVVGVTDHIIHDHIIKSFRTFQIVDALGKKVKMREIPAGSLNDFWTKIDPDAPAGFERREPFAAGTTNLKHRGILGDKKPQIFSHMPMIIRILKPAPGTGCCYRFKKGLFIHRFIIPAQRMASCMTILV